MAQDNTQGQLPPQNTPPGELPIVGEKKFFTHTMQEDVARSKNDPASFMKEQEAKKPFAQFIPPASTQNEGISDDKFREVIEDIPQRDQPFPLPESQVEPPATPPQFQVRIPTRGKSLSATTIILTVVLLLLIAGGAAGYWWFFMHAPQSEVVVQIPQPAPTPAPEPIIPQPVPEPAPTPEPAPVPEPVPQPIGEPATTTPVVEPIATSTPVVEPIPVAPPPAPVIETRAPDAVLSPDHTVIIALTQLNKEEALGKITTENAQIADTTATIRYVFTLPAPTGLHYLSGAETAQLVGFTIPETLSPLMDHADFIGYKNAGTMRYGFASAITNKTAVKSAALTWEKTMLDDLSALYIEKTYEKPATTTFSTNTYLSFYKRYLNMPQPDVSLDWAVSDKYFLVATSKDMIYALLNKASQVKK